jgi:hypothetical protein
MAASLGSNSWSGTARYADDGPIHEGQGPLERGAQARMPADDDVQAPSVGTVIAGTYRLDRVLGAGAMGSVFAATHLRNANRVAVKILHPDLTNNVDVRTRFLREGYAANSVCHAGTVRALDDGTTESGAAFFVMELLDGETLDALCERRGRRISPSEVAQLMVQLLDILAAAHAKGIVHRDIKPENLFLEHDGTLRVLDFGVARVLEGTLTETRAGSIIGTLPYMAPEQTLGKCHEVDARSDIWSVGATAFTLVSGRFVHDAETPEEMMVFNGSRQPRSLAEVAPDVASEFVDVVDRALRFDKADRWSSALAMRAALAEVSRKAQGPGHRRHGWATVGAVALILAGAVEARSALDRRPARPPSTALASVVASPDAPADVRAGTDATSGPQGASAGDPPTPMPVAPIERGFEAAPAAPMPAVPKAAMPAHVAALASSPRPDANVAPAAPDDCTPPFTILPVTGKKQWKRRCL